MKNVNIKSEWIEIISSFAPEIRGQVWDAVINYCYFNTVPENLSDAARMAFLLIKSQVDKARAQRERARARGAQKSANSDPSNPSACSEPSVSHDNVDLLITDMGPKPLKAKVILHQQLHYNSDNGDFKIFENSPAPWLIARNIPKEKARDIIFSLAQVNATAQIRPTS